MEGQVVLQFQKTVKRSSSHRRPSGGLLAIGDGQEVFQPQQTDEGLLAIECLQEVFQVQRSVRRSSSYIRLSAGLLVIEDRQEVFQLQKTLSVQDSKDDAQMSIRRSSSFRRASVIIVESRQEVFQLQKAVRKSFSYRRASGGLLVIKDRQKIFQPQETVRMSSSYE